MSVNSSDVRSYDALLWAAHHLLTKLLSTRSLSCRPQGFVLRRRTTTSLSLVCASTGSGGKSTARLKMVRWGGHRGGDKDIGSG